MDNAALRARFDDYDRDGDGKLEFEEFRQVLDQLGAGYEEAQARSAFESIDEDHDGLIDLAEFCGWWVGR